MLSLRFEIFHRISSVIRPITFYINNEPIIQVEEGVKKDSHCAIKQKQKEISLVEVSHTIVNPGAMMIHLEHTFITKTTVMGTVRFGSTALLTGFRE
jgi:hypothetical protein